MKTENKTNRVTGILKKIFLFIMVFLIAGIFTEVHPVKADYEQYVKLKKCYSSESCKVYITASVKVDQYDWARIYRADKSVSDGGTFKLLDEFKIAGWTWWTDFGGDGSWYVSGSKNKVTCYADDCMLDGEVAFVDKSANPGHRYYYKVVAKSAGEKDWPTITSNILSTTTKLSAPDLTRSYSLDGKNIKIKWSQIAKAKGYQVYRYDGKTWKRLRTIQKGSALGCTDKKTKAGKTYKYKVRAYSEVNGKRIYSNFSSVGAVTLKNPTVKGNYKAGSVYGPSLNNKELMQVRRVVQSFQSNYIKKGMSDYEKARAAFFFLRSNCKYARKGWQYNGANTAWGALVYGEAQCSGFARGMKALCDAAGVKCYYVHANAKAYNPSHQWVEVRISGKWYIVDAQGGFFLVGSKTWRNSMGMSWNTKGLPKCSSSDYKKAGFFGSII